MSGRIVVYGLLALVLGALVLSFVQLYRRTDEGLRTFVPPRQILWLRGFRRDDEPATHPRFLDRLVYELTQFYHVMTLYLLQTYPGQAPPALDHLDVTYKSWVALQPLTVTVSHQTLDLVPGDILTVPWNEPLATDQPERAWVLHWSLHPVPRAFKVCRQDRDYIVQTWRKQRNVRVTVVQPGHRTITLR